MRDPMASNNFGGETMEIKHWLLNLSEVLGSGSYGKVVKAYDLENNYATAACKIVVKSKISKSAASDLRREAEIMSKLQHPNIMPLLDCAEDYNHIYLFMELFETDLLNFVQKRGPLPEANARVVFRQLVDAIRFMHHNNIVHGDLKLENILYDPETGRVCLIDFGFSKHAQPGTLCATNITASPGYVAPEIMRKNENEPYDPFPGDVYSLGVILFSMVYGLFPFLDVVQGRSYYQDGAQHPVGNSTLFRPGMKYAGPRRPSLTFPDTASLPLQRLLHQVLCKNQSERITIFEVSEHPWLAEPAPHKSALHKLSRGFLKTRVHS